MSPKIALRERLVLYEYGRTMLSVQLFEFTLRGLAVSLSPKLRDSADFDEVWQSVEPMFSGRVSTRSLTGKISADADLADELRVAVNTRNTLAHDYILAYRMSVLHEGRAYRTFSAELRRIRRKFDAVTDRLDLLCGELGLEPESG